MLRQPILINRPFVGPTPRRSPVQAIRGGARHSSTSDRPFAKEDGEVVIDQEGRRVV